MAWQLKRANKTKNLTAGIPGCHPTTLVLLLATLDHNDVVAKTCLGCTELWVLDCADLELIRHLLELWIKAPFGFPS